MTLLLNDRLKCLIDERISRQLSPIREEVHTATRIAGEAMSRVTSLERQLSKSEEANQHLSDKIIDLEKRLAQQENYSRKLNLIFDGVSPTSGKSPGRLIIELLDKMGIVNADTINTEACHFIGQVRDGKQSLLVRFTSRRDRDSVWNSKSKLKGTGVFIREHFSPRTTQVQKQMKPIVTAARDQGMKCYLKDNGVMLNGKYVDHSQRDKLPPSIQSVSSGERENSNTVAFYGKNSPFSNFHAVSFTVDNAQFNCTEQYYQLKKSEFFSDRQTSQSIMETSNPSEMKRLGAKVKDFNQERWETVCVEMMQVGNLAKFTQNEQMRDKLIATETKTLVESSSIDLFWGSGIGLHQKDTMNREKWTGQNKMGEVLCKVRSDIIQGIGKQIILYHKLKKCDMLEV